MRNYRLALVALLLQVLQSRHVLAGDTVDCVNMSENNWCNGLDCLIESNAYLCSRNEIPYCHEYLSPKELSDVTEVPGACCKNLSFVKKLGYYCAYNTKSLWQKMHCCNSETAIDTSDVWCCESEADCDYYFEDCYQFSHGIRMIYICLLLLFCCMPLFMVCFPLGMFAVPILILLISLGINLSIVGRRWDAKLHDSYPAGT